MSAPLFNLPKEIIFCERCVMSNQRPASVPEFKHTKNRDGATYLNIGADGICDACKHADNKNSIDWNQRQVELETLLDQHRKNNGEYDKRLYCFAALFIKKKNLFRYSIQKRLI